MTLSLFWSRYTLELQEQHLREVDAFYHYLIARERWNWLLAKIPEQDQIKILCGHNHGKDAWTCRTWFDHMLEWIKANKPPAVYDAVVDKIHMIEEKPIEELEKQAAVTFRRKNWKNSIVPVIFNAWRHRIKYPKVSK